MRRNNLHLNSVLDKQIEEAFSRPEDNHVAIILKMVNVLLGASSKDESLVQLYKKVGVENFMKILTTIGGRTVTFPTIEEFRENLMTSLIYDEKIVQKKTWDEIKKLMPFEFSPHSFSKKLASVEDYMIKELEAVIKKGGN